MNAYIFEFVLDDGELMEKKLTVLTAQNKEQAIQKFYNQINPVLEENEEVYINKITSVNSETFFTVDVKD